jgi:hypothetical protein
MGKAPALLTRWDIEGRNADRESLLGAQAESGRP